MVNALSAANAYKNQLKLQQNLMEGVVGEEKSSKPSFSEVLGSTLESTIDAQKNAEEIKLDALTGKADVTDLVTAIANAEMALNTIVTVRDRAISAYQDIIRMPI